MWKVFFFCVFLVMLVDRFLFKGGLFLVVVVGCCFVIVVCCFFVFRECERGQ